MPRHLPAERSSIGPACSAQQGSRGKIPSLYRHGVMASGASIRHTGGGCAVCSTPCGPGQCCQPGTVGAGVRGCRTPFTGHCLDQRLGQRGTNGARPRPEASATEQRQRPTACANVGPEPPKGPRVGQPPQAARTAPGGAAGPAGTAGRTETEPSCVGPRPWLPVKSHRGRRGSTSVWAQTGGASSQSVQYSGCACGRIIGHPLQPLHFSETKH